MINVNVSNDKKVLMKKGKALFSNADFNSSAFQTFGLTSKSIAVFIEVKWLRMPDSWKRFCDTVLAGFNEFSFNESSRFNESVLYL